MTRLYVEMEHHRATLTGAQQAAEKEAWAATNNYNSLTDTIREERQARKDLTEDITQLRSSLVNVFLTWGLFVAVGGAFLAGMMNQITRWLWAAFLAAVSSGWATLAAWWSS